MDTYTHGHAEPVLQSHRWRTAENSCGYLLPHLEAGQRLLDDGLATTDELHRISEAWTAW